jgi:hypothetical protein
MSSQHNEVAYGGKELDAIGIGIGLGEQDGVVRLGETLTPNIAYRDAQLHPELAFIRGERLLAAFVQVAAVAAENGGVALVVPAGSRFYVVLEAASFEAGSAGIAHRLQIQSDTTINATFATTQRGPARDTRWPTLNSQADLRSGTDPSAAVGTTFEQVRPVGTETQSFKHLPYVIMPGFGVILLQVGVNIITTANFKWRERQLLPRELRT